MILEIADIRIKSGQQTAFENAVHTALTTVFPKAEGFLHHSFRRCIESPDRYVLQLTWETLEDHTVGFRGSPLFTQWRAMVGEFFALPPHVEHFELVNAITPTD
jgi:heme-degrading monooxygenase HmoA